MKKGMNLFHPFLEKVVLETDYSATTSIAISLETSL
jgi:hypothetical protein